MSGNFESYWVGFVKGPDGKWYPLEKGTYDDHKRLQQEWWRNDKADKRYKSKNSSYEKMLELGECLLPEQSCLLEDEVINAIFTEKMHKSLENAILQLSDQEYDLVQKVYYENNSIHDYSEKIIKKPRTTIQYRHKRVLDKLRKLMLIDNNISPDIVKAYFDVR